MGDLIFDRPLGKSKSPVSIIPFVNTITAKDFENNENTSSFKVGGDAKLTIANSMNLDLTLNPDFSQVEVDQQVTNLTRFEVGLPERRQFLLKIVICLAALEMVEIQILFFLDELGSQETSMGKVSKIELLQG